MTWVYILGATVALVILIAMFGVCRRMKMQQKIKEEVEKDRAEGIVKSWG